jgi:hypothetical protein
VSEHRIFDDRLVRDRLQYVPVLNNLSLIVEPEYIHARMFLASHAHVADVNECQISVNGHALDLAGNAAGLLDSPSMARDHSGKPGCAVNVRSGYQGRYQIRSPLVESLLVKGANRFLHLLSVAHGLLISQLLATVAAWSVLPPNMAVENSLYPQLTHNFS